MINKLLCLNLPCRHCHSTHRLWRDQPSESHQLCLEPATFLQSGKPQPHRCWCWCLLHQALHHLSPHARPRPDHRRIDHRRPATEPLLHGRTSLRQCTKRTVRQHHHYSHSWIQVRTLPFQERCLHQTSNANTPSFQRHTHRHCLQQQLQKSWQCRRPHRDRREPLLHRWSGAQQLPKELQVSKVSGTQWDTLHSKHEQCLICAPKQHLHLAGLPTRNSWSFHSWLSPKPASEIRLHRKRKPVFMATCSRD